MVASSGGRGWIFCIPALLVLLVVSAYPLARTFLYSLTDATLGTLDRSAWNDGENYLYLLRDSDWWTAVRNTCVFAFFSVVLETFAGLCVALLLNQEFRGRGFVRAAVLVPWAIPTVVSARIWAWMFNDLYGVINEILLRIGLIREPVAWLAEDRLAILVLVLVDVWKTTPFMALMLLAGLQSIPRSVREAARVDGASAWREFMDITLPLLKPALWVAVIFRTLDALRIFDLPFVLTSNSRSTAVVSVYARQQMVDFQDVGFGSAASFLIFCVISLIAAVYLRSARGALGLEAAKAGEG